MHLLIVFLNLRAYGEKCIPMACGDLGTLLRIRYGLQSQAHTELRVPPLQLRLNQGQEYELGLSPES
jgi:hypothetical protein